jgi:hypothetical protein
MSARMDRHTFADTIRAAGFEPIDFGRLDPGLHRAIVVDNAGRTVEIRHYDPRVWSNGTAGSWSAVPVADLADGFPFTRSTCKAAIRAALASL